VSDTSIRPTAAKAVEEALNRWTRKALDDEMSGDLFLVALANSI